MEHSAKFERVRNYYNNGLWSKKKVRDAVAKAWSGSRRRSTGRLPGSLTAAERHGQKKEGQDIVPARFL